MKDKKNNDNNMNNSNKPLALDDKQRIKVLSPGMLVFKRFVRSKLAIAGSIILIFMFLFSFLGALITPYDEKEVFYKYDYMESEYALAVQRNEFINIELNNIDVHYSVSAMLNSYINKFEDEQTEMALKDNLGNNYLLKKLGNYCYLLYKTEYIEIAKYLMIGDDFIFSDNDYNTQEFKDIITQNISNNQENFQYLDSNFKILRDRKNYLIQLEQEPVEAILTSPLVFDSYSDKMATTEFKIAALKSLYNNQTFNYNNKDYIIDGNNDLFTIHEVNEPENIPYMNMSKFVVRRANGEDTLSIDYKNSLEQKIIEMEEHNLLEINFQILEDVLNEETNNIETLEHEYKIYKTDINYTIKNQQYKYLIDIHAAPSETHWLGTDSNGMDVLTRMMYGGRISLMIGFIVIFIEIVIGIILGGIAGYFGKWIDNLIMRLVDIFNCIPFLPIMIIIGSLFDKLQMDSYKRILWMMVVMGVFGWPSVARLVRGQILSFREQEFMIAAEATGLSPRRRIFKHLIPNVMPQLIVKSTMGLGSIILVESTLSFLGLGAKYPIATWGAMIYSVSTAADLVNYTYIWIPIGSLICLTVIAFNFVGDGLRDAFDPKMKR